jgi:putative FmdB family regulatory protein
MPIYEYQCEEGHGFDVLQKVGDVDIPECRYCQGKTHRVLSPANFVLKGPGFYANDYQKKTPPVENSHDQKKREPTKHGIDSIENGKD